MGPLHKNKSVVKGQIYCFRGGQLTNPPCVCSTKIKCVVWEFIWEFVMFLAIYNFSFQLADEFIAFLSHFMTVRPGYKKTNKTLWYNWEIEACLCIYTAICKTNNWNIYWMPLMNNWNFRMLWFISMTRSDW